MFIAALSIIVQMETILMPFRPWRLNEVVHPCQGILFSNTKEPTIDTLNNLDECPENYSEYKKPVPKGCVVYDST